MKFKNFKDEQELMDSINEDNKSLLVDYAMDLHERFGISIDEAINEVKRMMDAKKRGEKIETNYPEEDSLENKWKKEHPLVHKKRTKSPNYGKYSLREQGLLIEQELFTAIRAIHDYQDVEYVEFYARDYFEWFNEHYGIEPKVSYEKLSEMFEERRTTTHFKYEHYKGDNLARILGVTPDEKTETKIVPEGQDDDTDAR